MRAWKRRRRIVAAAHRWARAEWISCAIAVSVKENPELEPYRVRALLDLFAAEDELRAAVQYETPIASAGRQVDEQ